MRTLSLLTFGLALVAGKVSAAPDFHTDIAPLLRDYCAGCHNTEDFDGDLSVETFSSLMKGGENGPCIKPGDAGASLMVRLLHHEKKPAMPPKKEPQPAAADIALIEAWINAGAKGPTAPDVSILSLLKLPDDAPAGRNDPAIVSLETSPDGTRLLLARSNRITLLQANDQQEIRHFEGLPGRVTSAHFSPDGNQVIAASGVAGLKGVALLWDQASGKLVAEYADGHADMLYDAEISPDGKWLATAGYDRRILLREKSSGKISRSIEVHNGAIFDLAFSPDSKVLASASADETVKLWKVPSGERLDTLNQPQGAQNSVLFTPDGQSIIAAGADNRIRIWHWVSKDKAQINPLVEARFAHENEIVRLALPGTDESFLVLRRPDRESLESAGRFPVAYRTRTIRCGCSARSREGGILPDGPLGWIPERGHFPAASILSGKQPGRIPAHPNRCPSTRPVSHPVIQEREPNDAAQTAQVVTAPFAVKGRLATSGDIDFYRFTAKAGQAWVLETKAARDKSPADTKVAILNVKGEPIQQVVLQAVRDSWFTFRGKDSTTPEDFRVQNWMEMDLNQYLYANGEVVKLWMYPRGPDSGFKVYPGMGSRHTYFGTTAQAHALGAPCYIVRPLPAGSVPTPNGLPVFTLYLENDDEPTRRLGQDSQLIFTVPADGDYLATVTDVRGFGGPAFHYELSLRPQQPDFSVTVGGGGASISPGSGREFSLSAQRLDGFSGEITAEIMGLPPGFSATSPIVIEAGQFSALGAVYASRDAKAPTAAQTQSVKLLLTGRSETGQALRHELSGALGEFKLGPPAKLRIAVFPDGQSGAPVTPPGKHLTLTIQPGQTITAKVQAERLDFKERIELGKEDAGRNLPHGSYVDNIGLNGLLIVEDQTERQFFITAAKWLPASERLFFIKASADGGQVSPPVLLKVERPAVAKTP
ncbi:MAG: c-type cytochrome domain-containing protein [Verrucomicrobiales bacterium]